MLFCLLYGIWSEHNHLWPIRFSTKSMPAGNSQRTSQPFTWKTHHANLPQSTAWNRSVLPTGHCAMTTWPTKGQRQPMRHASPGDKAAQLGETCNSNPSPEANLRFFFVARETHMEDDKKQCKCLNFGKKINNILTHNYGTLTHNSRMTQTSQKNKKTSLTVTHRDLNCKSELWYSTVYTQNASSTNSMDWGFRVPWESTGENEKYTQKKSGTLPRCEQLRSIYINALKDCSNNNNNSNNNSNSNSNSNSNNIIATTFMANDVDTTTSSVL